MADRVVIQNSGGLGFLGALTILFIALKLLGVIAWSWWWVLLPLWGLPAIVFSFWAVGLVAVGIVSGVLYLIDKKKYKEQVAARKARKALKEYARALR